MEALKNTRIYSVRSESVRKLDGFEKHHEVPNVVNHRALEWLDRLTRPQLDAKIDSVFSALRKAYGFKRRQLSVHGPHDRHAVIETPFFNYESSVELDANNPEFVLWASEVNHIREIEYLVSPEFESCFPGLGWTLEVAVEEPLELAEIVDRVEDKAEAGFSIDYDKDLSWCEIQIPDCRATLRATPDSINVSHATDSSPRKLLLYLVQFQTHLLNEIGLMRLQNTD